MANGWLMDGVEMGWLLKYLQINTLMTDIPFNSNGWNEKLQTHEIYFLQIIEKCFS